jgi:hypothetical protein
MLSFALGSLVSKGWSNTLNDGVILMKFVVSTSGIEPTNRILSETGTFWTKSNTLDKLISNRLPLCRCHDKKTIWDALSYLQWFQFLTNRLDFIVSPGAKDEICFMKLISKSLEKDSSGSVKLIAEEAEDLWHTYNLLARDDVLRATTVR